MVVHIKSGKRENGKSFCCNLYRKRSTPVKTKTSDGRVAPSGLRNGLADFPGVPAALHLVLESPLLGGFEALLAFLESRLAAGSAAVLSFTGASRS